MPFQPKGRAIHEKFEKFEKNLIFTLFGLKYIRKNGSKHDLKIAHKKPYPMPTPTVITGKIC